MSWNTHIPKFRRFVLQNFPFIEEDFDALTDYALICKVVEYLNQVIESQNGLISEVETFESNVSNEVNTFETNITNSFDRLEDLFIELKSFVDNYFDNLDVQQEINNKIEAMIDSGDFQAIIAGIMGDHFVPVELYGAVGDGITDDTQAIQDAIDGANEGCAILLTKTYKITNQINVNKRLTLCGGGIIKPLISTSKIALLVTANSIIQDITIDGELNTQDQFDQHTFDDLVLLTGIKFNGSESVEIDNITIKNFYGNAIQLFGHKQVSISNSRITNVGGHWYQNNTYDAFGDGLYFGETTGDTYINITNTLINGKYKSTTLSRCGICFENLGDSVDGNQYVNIQNFNIENYDRIIHIEGIDGKVYINGSNVVMKGNCLFNYGNDSVDQANLTLTNSNLSYTGNSYNGSYGMGKFKFHIKDSIIDATTREAIANYGAIGTYDNCVLTIGNVLCCNGANKVLFNNCTLNIASGANYIIYSSDVTYDHCTLNCESDTAQSSSNTKQKVISCTFNKYIVQATYLDLNSKINMSSDYELANGVRLNHRATTFMINNVAQFLPNIASTIPMINIERNARVIRRDISADGTISILPTFDTSLFAYRKNTKYALVSVGTNDWTHEATARNFNGVYLNIITTNTNAEPSVGATTQIGTVSSGYAFTIDDVNHTFARSGTYSNICISYLLEMNELSFIANYNS